MVSSRSLNRHESKPVQNAILHRSKRTAGNAACNRINAINVCIAGSIKTIVILTGAAITATGYSTAARCWIYAIYLELSYPTLIAAFDGIEVRDGLQAPVPIHADQPNGRCDILRA
jgi:hypothetical protein